MRGGGGYYGVILRLADNYFCGKRTMSKGQRDRRREKRIQRDAHTDRQTETGKYRETKRTSIPCNDI